MIRLANPIPTSGNIENADVTIEYGDDGKPSVVGWPEYGPRPVLDYDAQPLTICVTLSTHPGEHCWQP